jgi:hypothetical protein
LKAGLWTVTKHHCAGIVLELIESQPKPSKKETAETPSLFVLVCLPWLLSSSILPLKTAVRGSYLLAEPGRRESPLLSTGGVTV